MFRRGAKLYVADKSDWASSGTAHVTTVQDNKKCYSKAELKRANEAAEMVQNSGFTTERDAVNLGQDNNLEQIPVTAHDISRAFDIYSKRFESVRGKRTKKKVRRTEIDLFIKAEQPIPQRMYSDVFAIREQRFLMTLAEPLGLVLTTHAERKTTEELGLALHGQINVVRSRGFKPQVVYMDPQPALKALQHQMTGVEVDVSGAGDHLDKIDGKIRRLKELYCSVHAVG